MILLLLGCSYSRIDIGETGLFDSDDQDSGGDSGDTAGGDTAAGDDVKPYVTAVEDVHCQDDGDLGETWYVTVLCDDPQGADTVYIGSQTVLGADGQPIANYGLDCYDGVCDSYFRAEYDSLWCASAPELTFVFAVQDAEFHWSDPWYHTPL